ncbi:Uncharacterised protein [Mycobacterium tuberculosis]|nr:Uncharacterised protein [Mycobacterium tuberculosis]
MLLVAKREVFGTRNSRPFSIKRHSDKDVAPENFMTSCLAKSDGFDGTPCALR